MVKELYIRTPDDPMFEDGVLEYSNEIESIISKIRVILGTSPGDVLGEPTFGVDLEHLVFNTRVDSNAIEKKINDAIISYVNPSLSNGINVSVSMGFGHANNGTDYGILDIYINGVKTVGILVDRD